MSDLGGTRVLVVEDETPVAMLIEDMLENLGCKVVASLASLARAEVAAAEAEIELAMLDINLAGNPVFPVAEILRARNIAILFSTGYGQIGLPAEFSEYPVIAKPFAECDLKQKILLALQPCA
jgi:CheY-like chemotaxis protein